ncbi:DUF2332 domain-containing protein [Sutcliffiella deserti]|uniref:DUF2332 domain-containing protein n=1 Tax=Sutcliffiella deserti TaxID=2875501 RepID=UPI001CBC9059|nr:DUF2332 domain-containing protein [Sutcliffiella deserti]
MELNQVSVKFKTFAQKECAGSSELYEYLSLKIVEDVELLKLSSYAREGQPIPNLFFGAVHYLLMNGEEHPLRQYYPSLVEKPKETQESFQYFRDFCSKYNDHIISLLREKLVQTNEVRRCGYLYPSFTYVYNKAKKPLALIEIGTSAGFQLLWDKYAYSYNSDEVFGDSDSKVYIRSEIKGENTPILSKVIPAVTHRYGLDLHINDVSNVEDVLWLNALIWPEHKERRALFEQAVSYVTDNKDELNLIEGDGVKLLSRIIEQIPNDSTICIFHTHVANQIPVATKYKLLENVKEIAKKRDVCHIYNNIWDRDLHLDYYINGIEHNETIAETDGHGRWFKWKL